MPLKAIRGKTECPRRVSVSLTVGFDSHRLHCSTLKITEPSFFRRSGTKKFSRSILHEPAQRARDGIRREVEELANQRRQGPRVDDEGTNGLKRHRVVGQDFDKPPSTNAIL